MRPFEEWLLSWSLLSSAGDGPQRRPEASADPELPAVWRKVIESRPETSTPAWFDVAFCMEA